MRSFFPDDAAHLVPFFFHVPDKLELRPGAVEVVLGILDGEIFIPFEIVRQKARAALERHRIGSERKAGDLLFRQRGAGLDKAAGKDAEQMQVEPDLVEVLLVLGRRGGAEADRVAEVVG